MTDTQPVRSDDEWAELVDLISIVFGPDDAETWQTFHSREPFCRREWCKIIKRDGQIASHICWLPRPMRIGSVVVRAGTIGYTATHPRYRGQGMAAALMEAWTAELTQRGEHLSFLTGIPKFYEPFGYEFCFPVDRRDPAVTLVPAQLVSGGGEEYVRPYRQGDQPALAALYEAENARRTGSLVRKQEYWDWLLDGLHASGWVKRKDIWVVEGRDRQPAGYVMLHPGPLDRLAVWEASAPTDRTAAALLGAVADQAQARGCRVHLMLPLDHRMTRYALSGGARLSGYSYGMYARILDLPSLFEALRPELEQRLRMSAELDWRGTLRLSTDIGTVDVGIADGHVELGAGIEPLHTVEMPQSLLVKLVTGYTNVHWVAGVLQVRWMAGLGSAYIEPALWPILDALFPKGCPYVWTVDTWY